MNKKIGISLFVGTVVSITTLYFAFRNVPIRELLEYLTSINYIWIIPTVAVILFAFGLRAARWRFILASSYPVGFWQAFHPLMIGFMINCVLPGRVGEFARPFVLNRKEAVPVSTGLATVAVERIFDLIILLLLFLAVSSFVRIAPGFNVTFGGHRLNYEVLVTVFNGMLKIGVLMVIGLLLVTLGKTRELANRLILSAPEMMFFASNSSRDWLNEKVCRPAVRIIENIASGMALIKDPKRIIICFFYSLAVWFFTALSYYLFSIGCPEINLTLSEIVAVMVIICFVIALPSVPGYWGLWEAGGVFAMLLFGVSENEAAGYTLANHAVQIVPVVLVGLVSAWISGVSIRQVYEQPQ
ncbi:MAG: lysylphosphatidylglycerol synthase transmembrane domain-containing protein [Desulfobacterales bacterium]